MLKSVKCTLIQAQVVKQKLEQIVLLAVITSEFPTNLHLAKYIFWGYFVRLAPLFVFFLSFSNNNYSINMYMYMPGSSSLFLLLLLGNKNATT